MAAKWAPSTPSSTAPATATPSPSCHPPSCSKPMHQTLQFAAVAQPPSAAALSRVTSWSPASSTSTPYTCICFPPCWHPACRSWACPGRSCPSLSLSYRPAWWQGPCQAGWCCRPLRTCSAAWSSTLTSWNAARCRSGTRTCKVTSSGSTTTCWQPCAVQMWSPCPHGGLACMQQQAPTSGATPTSSVMDPGLLRTRRLCMQPGRKLAGSWRP
mmetsp:Transcript_22644/g.49579  ORF Transcript_22644/g.49579 Transcript_22644/m.49579 type:complete len:213 (+) Transcript_22644:1152-1790(+)